MEKIRQFLAGEISASDFIQLVKTDEDVRSTLSILIPKRVAADRNHELWRHTAFERYEKYSFNLLNTIISCNKLDNSPGENLNLFGDIRDIYQYVYDEICFTDKYEKIFGLYLDIIQDCYDGPEVERIVFDLLEEVVTIRPKTHCIQEGKRRVHDVFHVESNKRPYWIQGPEWPMGKNSPMKYIERKRRGEAVDYYFTDIDTQEIRTITQYY